MKEKDLVKLGFKRIDVSQEESGDKSYHYYTYFFINELDGFSLISSDSDKTKNDDWFAFFWMEERIKFKDKKELRKLINLITNNFPKNKKD